MKEYLALGAIGVGLAAMAAIVGLDSADPVRDANMDGDACPSSRTHIEASLHTTRADGLYHRLTLKSVRMPIRDVIIRMRGKTRARATAVNIRAFAQEKLANGATGAERRYHLDSILRADALLAILDCMERQRAL